MPLNAIFAIPNGAILKEIASEEKEPEQQYQGVNYDFDKTHEILYPDCSESISTYDKPLV